MSSFTLDDIKAAASKQFGDTEVTIGEETVVFRNAMRLPKATRVAITGLFRKDLIAARLAAGEESLDVHDLHREALQLAARSERDFKLLEEAIGDDPAQWLTIFNAYNGTADLGEASTSAS